MIKITKALNSGDFLMDLTRYIIEMIRKVKIEPREPVVSVPRPIPAIQKIGLSVFFINRIQNSIMQKKRPIEFGLFSVPRVLAPVIPLPSQAGM